MEIYKAFLQDSTNPHAFTFPGISGTLFGVSENPGWDEERWVLTWDMSNLLVNDWSPATTPCLSGKYIKVGTVPTNRATRLPEVTAPLNQSVLKANRQKNP